MTTIQCAVIHSQNDFLSNIVTIPIFSTPVLSSIACSPTTFTPNSTLTCSVALTVGVPTGETTITLSSNNSLLPVPASVTDTGGLYFHFVYDVGTIPSSQTATLTATLGTLTSTIAITSNP